MAKKGAWIEMVLRTGGVVAFALILGSFKAAPQSQQGTLNNQWPLNNAAQPNSQNGDYGYQPPSSSQVPPDILDPQGQDPNGFSNQFPGFSQNQPDSGSSRRSRTRAS